MNVLIKLHSTKTIFLLLKILKINAVATELILWYNLPEHFFSFLIRSFSSNSCVVKTRTFQDAYDAIKKSHGGMLFAREEYINNVPSLVKYWSGQDDLERNSVYHWHDAYEGTCVSILMIPPLKLGEVVWDH